MPNSAIPFNPSLFLFVTLSPPGSLLPEKTKKPKQTESGGKVVQWPVTLRHSQDTGDSFSRSLALSYIWQEHPSLQQMSWLKVPTTLPPSLSSLSPSLNASCCPGTGTLAPRQARDGVMRREGGDRMKWRAGGGSWGSMGGKVATTLVEEEKGKLGKPVLLCDLLTCTTVRIWSECVWIQACFFQSTNLQTVLP